MHRICPKAMGLKSIFEENQHTCIDVLKFDIEGAEFDVVPAMLPLGLLCADAIKYATVETHQRLIKNRTKPRWADINQTV